MEENKRQITRNNSQINIVFKSNDNAAPMVVEEPPTKMPNHLENFTEQFSELHDMIGLDEVKDLVYQIYAMLQIKQYRQEAGLKADSHVFHMIFKGNPGTGKTTVARIIAKLLKSMGLLSKGHLIEVERADLVGEYIGHTAQKTRDLVKKALGGILFIDEAYSLARGGEKDFGKEAIDCLVKSMEDHKNEFVLVLAGYTDEIEFFLSTNPGLPSRFPIQVQFPDYTMEQLIDIAELMARDREYIFTPESTRKIREIINTERDTVLHFSNARFVRNIIEKAIRLQAVRILGKHRKPSKQELMELLPQDIALAINVKQQGTFGLMTS